MAVLFSLRSSLSILFAMRDRRDENIFSGLGQQLLAIDRSSDRSVDVVSKVYHNVCSIIMNICVHHNNKIYGLGSGSDRDDVG